MLCACVSSSNASISMYPPQMRMCVQTNTPTNKEHTIHLYIYLLLTCLPACPPTFLNYLPADRLAGMQAAMHSTHLSSYLTYIQTDIHRWIHRHIAIYIFFFSSTHTHLHMYNPTGLHAYIRRYTNASIHFASIHASIRIYTSLRIRAQRHKCVRTYIHIHIPIHRLIHTHTHTYIHIHIRIHRHIHAY